MSDPAPFLETRRLKMWWLVDGDDTLFVDLDSDPEVTRYINGGLPTSPEQAAEALDRVRNQYQQRPGQGLWRTTRWDTGATIGWFLLKWLTALDAVEVGYRLYRDQWGQGFATEGAAALVDYGFETLGLGEIVGICHPENAASRRVLEKNGLVYEGAREIQIRDDVHDVIVLRLRRADWEAARSPR